MESAGPDRSISMETIQKARKLKARRYRNRRLGDFLKELDLSEGRATGIPTIQDELHKNGSQPARIETDDERSYFLLEIPCREGFDLGNTFSDLKSDLKNKSDRRRDISELILKLISDNPDITIPMLIEQVGLSGTTIKKCLKQLKDENRIERIGPRNGGKWMIV